MRTFLFLISCHVFTIDNHRNEENLREHLVAIGPRLMDGMEINEKFIAHLMEHGAIDKNIYQTLQVLPQFHM